MDNREILLKGRQVGMSYSDVEYWKDHKLKGNTMTNYEKMYKELRSKVAYITGRLDIVPQNAEGKLCVDVREELLDALDDSDIIQITVDNIKEYGVDSNVFVVDSSNVKDWMSSVGTVEKYDDIKDDLANGKEVNVHLSKPISSVLLTKLN